MFERLKHLISRFHFKIPILTAIGGEVIACETNAALRKDVTAKYYGGYISRKKALLDNQKEDNARMRDYGNINILQDAFIAPLRIEKREFKSDLATTCQTIRISACDP
jgi:GTP-binding protein LepA